MVVLFEIIIIAVLCFLIDLFTYKYVRYLDKKERAKLIEKESEYIKEVIESLKNPIQTEKTPFQTNSEDDLLDF